MQPATKLQHVDVPRATLNTLRSTRQRPAALQSRIVCLSQLLLLQLLHISLTVCQLLLQQLRLHHQSYTQCLLPRQARLKALWAPVAEAAERR